MHLHLLEADVRFALATIAPIGVAAMMRALPCICDSMPSFLNNVFRMYVPLVSRF